MPDLTLTLRAINESKAALAEAEAQLKGLGAATDQATTKGVGWRQTVQDIRDVGIAAMGAYHAAKMVADQIGQMIETGMRVERAKHALEVYAGGAEEAEIAIQKMRDATAGMVDDLNLTLSASRFFAMGIAETTDEAAKLAEIAVTLGAALGKDAKGAMEEFALLMANQSIPRLDTFGISAGRVRMRISELKEEGYGMTQAFNLAVLEEGVEKMEALGGASDIAGGSIDRLGARMDNLGQRISVAVLGVVDEAAGKLLGLVDLLEGREIELPEIPTLLTDYEAFVEEAKKMADLGLSIWVEPPSMEEWNRIRTAAGHALNASPLPTVRIGVDETELDALRERLLAEGIPDAIIEALISYEKYGTLEAQLRPMQDMPLAIAAFIEDAQGDAAQIASDLSAAGLDELPVDLKARWPEVAEHLAQLTTLKDELRSRMEAAGVSKQEIDFIMDVAVRDMDQAQELATVSSEIAKNCRSIVSALGLLELEPVTRQVVQELTTGVEEIDRAVQVRLGAANAATLSFDRSAEGFKEAVEAGLIDETQAADFAETVDAIMRLPIEEGLKARTIELTRLLGMMGIEIPMGAVAPGGAGSAEQRARAMVQMMPTFTQFGGPGYITEENIRRAMSAWVASRAGGGGTGYAGGQYAGFVTGYPGWGAQAPQRPYVGAYPPGMGGFGAIEEWQAPQRQMWPEWAYTWGAGNVPGEAAPLGPDATGMQETWNMASELPGQIGGLEGLAGPEPIGMDDTVQMADELTVGLSDGLAGVAGPEATGMIYTIDSGAAFRALMESPMTLSISAHIDAIAVNDLARLLVPALIFPLREALERQGASFAPAVPAQHGGRR